MDIRRIESNGAKRLFERCCSACARVRFHAALMVIIAIAPDPVDRPPVRPLLRFWNGGGRGNPARQRAAGRCAPQPCLAGFGFTIPRETSPRSSPTGSPVTQ